MHNKIIEKIQEALERICQCFNKLCDALVEADLSENIEPYSPRARPTHWQRIPEPKIKPHTLPVLHCRRVFHCRNCLPFVVIVADEE